jgi:hypothetical protein
VVSPEFRNWWAEHDVDTRCRGLKRFHHPVVGDLAMHTEALQLPDGNRWLYAYAAEPGSRSAEAMRLLGTWAATCDPPQMSVEENLVSTGGDVRSETRSTLPSPARHAR